MENEFLKHVTQNEEDTKEIFHKNRTYDDKYIITNVPFIRREAFGDCINGRDFLKELKLLKYMKENEILVLDFSHNLEESVE